MNQPEAASPPKPLAPVLWLTLLILILEPVFSDMEYGRSLSSLLVGGTAVVALTRSGVRSQVRTALIVMVLTITAIGGFARHFGDAEWLQIIAAGLYTILLMVTPVVMVRRLALRPKITFDTVAGAIAAYVQMGLFFASLFHFVSLLTGEPFFSETGVADSMDYMFFSFVTLTTLGYGDLTPGTDTGQMLSVIEALLGQVFLITVVALTVGNLGGLTLRGQRESSRTNETVGNPTHSQLETAAAATVDPTPAEGDESGDT